jgi:hypothetical protein
MRRGVGRNVSESGRALAQRTGRGRSDFSDQVQISHHRALIARFFADLRRALRLTLPQAAHYLQVPTDVIDALETGQVEYLPRWHQTTQIVMGYTALAGVDGRPVLNAIGALIVEISEPPAGSPEAGSYAQQTGRTFMRAGSVIASGARRLPKDAMHQIRARPQRALYALSLPLLLVVLFHASAFDMLAKPFGSAVRSVSAYFQEHFAPERDGFRWIEVDDPRSRRADKLQIGGGSY